MTVVSCLEQGAGFMGSYLEMLSKRNVDVGDLVCVTPREKCVDLVLLDVRSSRSSTESRGTSFIDDLIKKRDASMRVNAHRAVEALRSSGKRGIVMGKSGKHGIDVLIDMKRIEIDRRDARRIND